MDIQLIQTLVDAGFSDKEAKVYLAILEMWTAEVSVIARRSGVKRVTVYPILEELKKKEIAQETTQNDIKYYAVISPDKVFQNVQKKYQEFEHLLPEFLSLKDKYGDRPRIQFFDGFEKVNEMLYEYAEVWIKSISQYDTTRWGYQDNQFVDQYIDWLNRYRQKQVPNEKIYLISNESVFEAKTGPKLTKSNQRIIKKAPESMKFTSTVRVVGDYIVMIYNQNDRHYAFQMHDKEFAQNMREFFKMMWSML